MYSDAMSRRRKKSLLDAPGFGGRWFGDRRKKRRRGLLISPIEFGKKKGSKRDMIDRASKRLERRSFGGDDRRAGLILRLLMLINRERGIFQPPMSVVEDGTGSAPASVPVTAQPGMIQRAAQFLIGLFRRR